MGRCLRREYRRRSSTWSKARATCSTSSAARRAGGPSSTFSPASHSPTGPNGPCQAARPRGKRMRIGLTLPNRGILFGATTVDTMLQLAEDADRSGLFDAVWVGDRLLGKPRLESITLLAAVAGRTKKVRLSTACMASFPLRDPVLLAYQWA